MRRFAASLLVLSSCAAPTADSVQLRLAPTPPSQAAHVGFTRVLFNSNFASGTLASRLSCAGTPQVAPWKQGLWWEGQNNPNGVAPCGQISVVDDPSSGQRVLDLEWTPNNADTYDATTVSTFPLNTYPFHFSFRHGYVEVVARIAPMAPGVWPAIWMWSDNSTVEVNTPPFVQGMPSSEMDIMEAYGPNGTVPVGMDSALHEYYGSEVSSFLFNDYPAKVDPAQVHVYGFLWTSDGAQWQGGHVCSYIDNVLRGCQATTAASEAQQMFLILSMGIGCNYNYRDRSCLGALPRVDMYVSRVTVFGQ